MCSYAHYSHAARPRRVLRADSQAPRQFDRLPRERLQCVCPVCPNVYLCNTPLKRTNQLATRPLVQVPFRVRVTSIDNIQDKTMRRSRVSQPIHLRPPPSLRSFDPRPTKRALTVAAFFGYKPPAFPHFSWSSPHGRLAAQPSRPRGTLLPGRILCRSNQPSVIGCNFPCES